MQYNAAIAKADAAAAMAVGGASASWIVQANEVLTLIGTIVAIVVGIGAGLFHYERWWNLRKARKEKERGD